MLAGGDLWTWGRGDAGQLGHGDRRDRCEPKLVAGLSDVWVLSADGGDYHTIACADNGKAYAFGSGEQGQLGLGVGQKHSSTPETVKAVPDADGDGALFVAAASEHSLIQMRSGA